MKAYGEVALKTQVFLTSALVGGEWSASRPRHFISRERAPGTRWIGGWVGSRTSLEDMEKLKFLPSSGLVLQPSGRASRSQSLYRLRYPGSSLNMSFFFVNNFPLKSEDNLIGFHK
jgi:hypothetical protein